MIRLRTVLNPTRFHRRLPELSARTRRLPSFSRLYGPVHDAALFEWHALHGRLLVSHREIHRVFGHPRRPADPD